MKGMSGTRSLVPAGPEAAPSFDRAAPSVAQPDETPVPVRGLTVGAADDPAERAADVRADRALARLRRARLRRTLDGPSTSGHVPGAAGVRRSPAPGGT